jgi:hypothetical protein
MFSPRSRNRFARQARTSGRKRSLAQRKPTVEMLETRVVPTVSVPTKFAGINFTTNPVTPPDNGTAVGPVSIVEGVNTSIKIFNKAGGTIAGGANGVQFTTFFASVFKPTTATYTAKGFSDPYVLFDNVQQRYVIGMIEIFSYTNGAGRTAESADLDIAVSTSNNPTTLGAADWKFYQDTAVEEPDGLVPAPSVTLPDFPKMGSNADVVTFSFNQFDTDPVVGGFLHNQILSVPWVSLTGGVSGTTFGTRLTGPFMDPPGSTFNDLATASDWNILIPAHMDSSSAAGAGASVPGGPMYFVQSNNTPFFAGPTTNITVWQNDAPLGANTFTPISVNVAPYFALKSQPGPVPLPPGPPGLTFQIDSRMLSVDFSNGKLVAAQDIGVGPDTNTHARWYELSVDGLGSANLIQQGTIGVGTGADSTYPAVAINQKGDVGLTYIVSGNPFITPAFSRPGMYVTGRLASDPLGTLQAPQLVVAGNSAASPHFGRGGDYASAQFDVATGAFWASTEFTLGANTDLWGTEIAKFTLTGAIPPNPNPLWKAVNDNYTVKSGATIVTNAANGVLANDIPDAENDPPFATLNSLPPSFAGTLNFFGFDGSFSFTAKAGFKGKVVFSYFVQDADGKSNVATVTITVT